MLSNTSYEEGWGLYVLISGAFYGFFFYSKPCIFLHYSGFFIILLLEVSVFALT